MLFSVIYGLIFDFFCWAISEILKRLGNILFGVTYTDEEIERFKNSKKAVKIQFFVCLFLLPISLLVFFLVDADSYSTVILKICMLMTAFFSFIFVWGAFETAVAFFPDDGSIGDVQPQQATDERSDESCGKL